MKITLFFFTFLGINKGFAQKQTELIDSNYAKQSVVENHQPKKNDTLADNEKPSARLFPNPTKNKVEIEIKGFKPGYVQVQLVDNSGKIIRNDKRLVFSGNEIIILMFSEKPGLYYILLKQDEKNARNKLVIQ